MNYSNKRPSDDRRRGSGKDDYSTKGDKERVREREKVKVDTKRLAALRIGKKDATVLSYSLAGECVC